MSYLLAPEVDRRGAQGVRERRMAPSLREGGRIWLRGYVRRLEGDADRLGVARRVNLLAYKLAESSPMWKLEYLASWDNHTVKHIQ